MAGFDPAPHVARMTSDSPFEHDVGEIQTVTISTDPAGRAMELSGVLVDGTRWEASIPMPPDWWLVRTAPGTTGIRVVTEPEVK